MTIEKLLESLKEQRDAIAVAIGLIESHLKLNDDSSKKKAIIHSVKKFKKHHKWSPEHRAKFMATMAVKRKKEKG